MKLSEATQEKLKRPFPFERWAIRFGELAVIESWTLTIEGDETDSTGWTKTGALQKGEMIIPLQMVPLPKGRVAVQCLSQRGLVIVWSRGANVRRP